MLVCKFGNILSIAIMASCARTHFTCFKCQKEDIHGYDKLTMHLRHQHGLKTSGKSSSAIICSQNGCKQEFYSWNNYRYHVLVCEVAQAAVQLAVDGINDEPNDMEIDEEIDRSIPSPPQSPFSPQQAADIPPENIKTSLN